MTHTPGPWRYDDDGAEVVADTEVYVFIAHEASGDNGALIAAAPELLEALEMVRDADEDCRRDGLHRLPELARAKIDAAIAKARGVVLE